MTAWAPGRARSPRMDWLAIASVVAPFVIALVLGGLVLLASGRNPLSVYGLMAMEGFGGAGRIAATLTATTPILFCAVATAVTFRAGVFNVGVEGGFYLGGLAGAVAGFTFTGLPSWLLIVAELSAGAAIGGLWLTLPGLLKARLDVDEVVSTLMLNFVAINLTGFLVNGIFLAPRSGNSATPMIAEAGWLPRLMPPSTLNIGFLIALALLLGYHLWDRFTSLGFEARMTGLNPRFSAAVGVDVPALIIKTMILSGVIAGLAGAAHAAGVIHRFVADFSPGYGFTGLAVALLGRNTALGMLLGSIVFGALDSAGATVQLFSDIPIEIVDVLQGAVTIFAVVPARTPHASPPKSARMIDSILDAAFLVTTPLLLTAIGGMLNRVGGVVNIGLEAMMLAGAYVALVVSSATQSWPLALAAALAAGAAIGLMFSLTVTRLGANEIVAGVGFDVATAGIIGFILKDIYHSSGTLRLPDVVMLPRIVLPGIADLPVLGAIFSNKDPVTWLAWLSAPLSAFMLARTRMGLRLRAAGTAPEALVALGLRPLRIRDASTVAAGAMAGLAGAQLSIGVVGVFSVGISAGRGYIALAAFYFGRNRPGLTAAGALLFGLFDAIQINMQGRGVPSQLVHMLPYVMVIFVLTAISIAERRQRLMRGV